jgi:hypothetical protein
LPMLIGPRDKRPAIIHCGVSYLQCTREDGAPYHAGYPPAESAATRGVSEVAGRGGEGFSGPVA